MGCRGCWDQGDKNNRINLFSIFSIFLICGQAKEDIGVVKIRGETFERVKLKDIESKSS